MIIIPLIYFLLVFGFLWNRNRTWNMDLAATTLLVIISFFAIVIDVKGLYGDYGINEDLITLPTLILFCLQWTIVILLLHFLSNIPFEKHAPIKEPVLYVFFIVMILSSFIMIVTKAQDIVQALVMDLADVRAQHYKDLSEGDGGMASYLLVIPSIFITPPFPTLALFFWFYMKAFTKCSLLLRTGMLTASIVQALISIIIAGRAAMIYWAFDFFIVYGFFHQYLSKETKRTLFIAASIFGSLAGFLFLSITLARFDGSSFSTDPFDSLYGYAGQHINNFCTMFVMGGDSPTTYDRIFPFMSKLAGNPYDMVDHYEEISSHLPGNVMVNVFDTYGGEIYLDLGWVGFVFFHLFLIGFILYVKSFWQKLAFNRIFILVIFVAFFTHGLFAWPFTGHYTTIAIMIVLFCSFLFKYAFKT